MTRSPTVAFEARAKINLYLEVLGRLPNGYHAVETLYQSVALADTLVAALEGTDVVVETNSSDVPTDDGNLIVRAARLFFAFVGAARGVRFRLEKRIPVGGGLGGGSADAAAALIALNELCGARYPLETLIALGSRLGADVAFCLLGGTAWGHGIGDQLTPARQPGDPFVVLVNPGFGVETRAAFAALEMPFLSRSPSVLAAETARRQRQIRLTDQSARDTIPPARLPDFYRLYNRFEPVIFARYPAIAEARDALRHSGAESLMSGSGATVFGLFADESQGRAVAESLWKRFPFVRATRFAASGIARVE